MDGDTPRVLLVDDREDNLMALEAVLEPLGYDLLTASSGAEALRLLLDTEVSAIVLDVQMPDMDGFETATLLKARQPTRSIPILFLTAVGISLEHELHGYEVGAVDYICKPFEPVILQAKVRAAVRWGSDLRNLERAADVYQEAADALASVYPAAASVSAAAPPARSDASSGGSAQRSAARSVAVDGDDGLVTPVVTPVVTTRVLDVALEAAMTAPASARHAVRQVLEAEPNDTVDIVVLLVSELMANAVLHAGSDTRLRLDLGEGVVRVEIDDADKTLPDPVLSDDMDERGRGLLLMDQLADRCGWNRLATGKTVWFELGTRN